MCMSKWQNSLFEDFHAFRALSRKCYQAIWNASLTKQFAHAKFVQPVLQWWIEQSGQNEGLTFIVMIKAWMFSKQYWFGGLAYSSVLIKQRGSNNSDFSCKKSSMNVDPTELSMCTIECWLNLLMNGNFFNFWWLHFWESVCKNVTLKFWMHFNIIVTYMD